MLSIRLTVAAFLLCSVGIASAPTPLNHHMDMLYGTKAGVDQSDNLWFWHYQSNTVTRLSPGGVETTSGILPDAISVDVDSGRGIVALAKEGSAIQVLTWSGSVLDEIQLPERAGDIAWMNGSFVAVTPLFADHRIEVWDAVTGKLARTIDAVGPIAQGVGEHIARATLVRYDVRHDRLVALDATFGHIFVYDNAGELIHDARLPATQTMTRDWLSEPDRETGRRRRNQTSVIWRFRALTIDSDGSAWVVTETDSAGTVSGVRYGADGTLQQVRSNGGTCSGRSLQAWHDQLVVFRDATGDAAVCAEILAPAAAGRLQKIFGGTVKPAATKPSTRFLTMQPNASFSIPFDPRPCVNNVCQVCSCPSVPGYTATIGGGCRCCVVSGCFVGMCCYTCFYFSD